MGETAALPHAPEFLIAPLQKLARRQLGQLCQLLEDHYLKGVGRLFGVEMRPTFRFGNHHVDDSQFHAVPGRQHQGFRGLPVQPVVMVGSTQGMVQRYRGINGVLLHQDTVGQSQGQGPLAAALAYDRRNDGRWCFHHQGQGGGDGISNPLLLGF